MINFSLVFYKTLKTQIITQNALKESSLVIIKMQAFLKILVIWLPKNRNSRTCYKSKLNLNKALKTL